MNWPQVPEDITSLSADQAESLANEIRLAVAAALQAGVSGDERAEVDTYMAHRTALKALAADKRLGAALEDESDITPAPAAPAATQVIETTATEADEADTEAATSAPLPTTFGTAVAPVTQATPATPVLRTAPEYLVAVSGVTGKNPGDRFESWGEVAQAAYKRGSSLNPTTSERFEIARIQGNYGPDRILSDDVMLNVAKFEPDSELMAAFCPPATPYYNLACANTLRRPVAASLPAFQAPRGRVSIMPSPALSDITTGYGQWTSTDDANANATKSTCQTITCGSPTEYEMYGVYRCLTVKNMMAMTYPELVEAYLNRLGAAHARLAEELLLNAMASAATKVNGRQLGYGGAVTITSTILNYIALYQEAQRWDIDGPLEGWAPRWVLWGMKMDIMRRRRTDGKVEVPSDGEIEQMFRNAGVNIHWFIDRPTWAVAIPSVSTASTLNLLPQSVQILLAQPGKFAMIDRGELAVGVTGNNIYRDNTSNSKNQFTFFFENFEGVVVTDSCTANYLDIPVCWNGAQIDDIVINCQGGDEAGYQS